ncbi:MAG TPA: hypothetical protein DCS93_14090 [Microscillaceae bacterium]|nr:hypothetical protein [Microscillaceae bacterium]
MYRGQVQLLPFTMKKISFLYQFTIGACFLIFLGLYLHMDSSAMGSSPLQNTALQPQDSPLISAEINALQHKMWACFACIGALFCGLTFVVIKKMNTQTDINFKEQHLQLDQLNQQNLLVQKEFMDDKVQEAQLLHQKLQNLVVNFEQQKISTPNFKTRFLLNRSNQLIPVMAQDIAYFFTQNKVVYVVDKNDQKYYTDQSLEELTQQLNPKDFFRANRQFILSIHSICKIHHYGNAKLKIDIAPACEEFIVISKAKVKEFKNWVANPQSTLAEIAE